MKKNRLLLIILILSLFSCKSLTEWKVRIPVPQKQEIDLGKYEKIFITDFSIEDTDKIEFELNKQIKDYFSSELKQYFEGDIDQKSLSIQEENVFNDKEYWKKLGSSEKKSIFLTGKSSFKKEIRKSLREARGGRFEDPFKREERLAERRFYSLTLQIFFINAETGEILFQKKYEESQGYANTNQTSEFAFYDLIQKVKEGLFPIFTGRGRFQERRLIIK
ncbi:MAG: hypothetical protein JXB26_15560 [Candidatus Aminicenantes bacterium]|nr:hypothetical protein [Candidatus Aminicenantes bacterium]